MGRYVDEFSIFARPPHRGASAPARGRSHETRTPAGKAMFQMLGVFAEFERSIIQERVRAGLQRAKREGKRLGRPPIADKLAERIRAALAGGMSVRKTAAKFDVDPSSVQRVAHPFDGAEHAPGEMLCRRVQTWS